MGGNSSDSGYSNQNYANIGYAGGPEFINNLIKQYGQNYSKNQAQADSLLGSAASSGSQPDWGNVDKNGRTKFSGNWYAAGHDPTFDSYNPPPDGTGDQGGDGLPGGGGSSGNFGQGDRAPSGSDDGPGPAGGSGITGYYNKQMTDPATQQEKDAYAQWHGMATDPNTQQDKDVYDAWGKYAGPSDAEWDTANVYQDIAHNPMTALDKTNLSGYQKWANGGPTGEEQGLIDSAKELSSGSDPRLAAAKADKTDIADTQNDQYLGGKYKGLVEHGGLTPAQSAALRTDANLTTRAGYDQAREGLGRQIATRGNGAGAYAAAAGLDRSQANALGEQARKNVLAETGLEREDRTAGLAGLSGVAGREQGKNLAQGQIDASRAAQNASLADAGSNRYLSSKTAGLSTLGSALNNQRSYQATGMKGATDASQAANANRLAGAKGMESTNASAREREATSLTKRGDQNQQTFNRQVAGLAGETGINQNLGQRSQAGAAGQTAIWNALFDQQNKDLEGAGNVGTKVQTTTNGGTGTGNTSGMGFSI